MLPGTERAGQPAVAGRPQVVGEDLGQLLDQRRQVGRVAALAAAGELGVRRCRGGPARPGGGTTGRSRRPGTRPAWRGPPRSGAPEVVEVGGVEDAGDGARPCGVRAPLGSGDTPAVTMVLPACGRLRPSSALRRSRPMRRTLASPLCSACRPRPPARRLRRRRRRRQRRTTPTATAAPPAGAVTVVSPRASSASTATSYTATAGEVTFVYENDGSIQHTLVIDGIEDDDFKLGSTDGDADEGTIDARGRRVRRSSATSPATARRHGGDPHRRVSLAAAISRR